MRSNPLARLLVLVGPLLLARHLAWGDTPPVTVDPMRVIEHSDSVKAVAFGPDGKLVLSADSGGIHIHETASGKETAFLKSPDADALFANLLSLRLSPDEKWVASSCGATNSMQLRDSQSGKVARTIELATLPVAASIAWAPDGKHLACAAGDKVQIRDFKTAAVAADWAIPQGKGAEIAYSPDGSKLLGISLLTLSSGVIHVWDSSTGNQLTDLKMPGGCYRWACFLDEKTIITPANGDGGGAAAVDISTGKTKFSFVAHGMFSTNFYAGALSHDRKLLVTGDIGAGDPPMVRLWDATNGHLLANLQGHKGTYINAVTFSPDDSLIASGGDDQTVCHWKVPKP